jgi:FixJ family two-component response regulator
LALQKTLAEGGSHRPIVFLTGQGDIPKSVRAMKGGAVDFLTKPVDDAVLLQAIEVALRKDAENRRLGGELAEIRRRWGTLTPREREVLQHVIAGRRNKQIAAALGTVERTVKLHRSRVMAKMNVRSVAELVRLAEQAGIRPK